MQEFVSLVNSFPEVLRVFLKSEVWIYLYRRLRRSNYTVRLNIFFLFRNIEKNRPLSLSTFLTITFSFFSFLVRLRFPAES